MNRITLSVVAAILAVAGQARADTFVGAIGTATTSPLPAASCLYFDQGSTTDTRACGAAGAYWASLLGLVPLNGDAGTPSAINLANGTLLPIGAGTTGTATVARGGTNATAAGGTAVDNISGFAFTGMVKRTGAGAYAAAVAKTDFAPPTVGSAIQKGDGLGGFTPAVSGTDYAPATSGSAIQKGNAAGGFANAVAGTDYAAALPGVANAPLFSNGSGGATAGTRSGNTTVVATTTGSLPSGHLAAFDVNSNIVDGGNPGGTGTVTSVNTSGPGGTALGITGGPVTGAGSFTFAWSGTSGGIPCYTSTTALSSSALLTANALTLGGGAGVCPSPMGSLGTTTTVLHGNAGGAPTFGVVANADLATMTAHTHKGNNTGSIGAPLDLTATQLTADLNVMVGDSGSGGTKGLVPAPATGDATKVLSGAGTYVVNGSGSSPTLTDTHGHTFTTPTGIAYAPGTILSGSSGSTVTASPTNEITTSATASYAITTADANTTVHLTHATPTPSIQAAATLGVGYGVSVQCDNACTLTPLSGTINGAASLVLAAHQTAALWTDGSTISAGIISATDPSNADNLISGKVANARGGAGSLSGLLKGTAGVVSAAVAGTDYAAATTGGANTPLFNNGSGGFTNGTRSGNTTVVGTVTGAPTSGNCVSWSSGNLADAGGPCTTGGGGGTVASGTANQIARYASTGTTVSGDASLTDDGSTLTATQAFALSGSISPTALSGNVNDYGPAGNSTAVRLSIDAGGADRNVTGLAGGASGVVKILYNGGTSGNLNLVDESASSSAANRFHIGSNGITVAPGKTRAFIYDAALSRWTNLDFGGGNTGVTAGSYTSMNATVSADGRITAASNGSAGGGFINFNTGSAVLGSPSNLFFGVGATTGSTLAAVRPWVAPAAMTIYGMKCWAGTAPSAGHTHGYALTVGVGGSTSATDHTEQQQNIADTANNSTTSSDTDVSISAGDVVAIHVIAVAGTVSGIGTSCTVKWR